MNTRPSKLTSFAAVLCLPLTMSLAAESPEAVYRKLSSALPEESAHAVADDGEFDLRRNDVSDVMLRKINQLRRKGDTPLSVLQTIFSAEPEKGVRWLLQNWEKLTAVGREHALIGLGWADFRESYELAEWLLNDRDALIHPLDEGLYEPRRVCDVAYGVLVKRLLRNNVALPTTFSATLGSQQPVADRDAAIQQLKAWWTPRRESILASKAALAAKAPDLKNRIDALKAKKGN